MLRAGDEIELEALRRAAPRYEKQGFRVHIQPGPEQRPAFLRDYQPDAIARRNGEGVIIEVKATRSSAEESAIIGFLSREVPKHEGWRFDLILASDEVEQGLSLRAATASELESELVTALKLVDQSEYKAALPFLWGLLEGAARVLVFNEPSEMGRRYLPQTVVEKLVSEGFVDDRTSFELFDIAHLRNQIVHGYTNVWIDKLQIQTLVDVIQRLIAAIETDEH